jgi:hypothetical protein
METRIGTDPCLLFIAILSLRFFATMMIKVCRHRHRESSPRGRIHRRMTNPRAKKLARDHGQTHLQKHISTPKQMEEIKQIDWKIHLTVASPDLIDSGGYDNIGGSDDDIRGGAAEGGEHTTAAGCGRWCRNLRMNERRRRRWVGKRTRTSRLRVEWKISACQHAEREYRSPSVRREKLILLSSVRGI